MTEVVDVGAGAALPRTPLARTASELRAVRLHLPVCGVALIAGALVWRGWHALAGAGQVSAIRDAQTQLAGPIVLGFVLTVFMIERQWPAEPRPVLARGHRVDALYFVVHALAGVPIMVLAGTGFSSVLAQHLPWLVLPRMLVIPRVVFVCLAIVGIDAFDWIAHAGSHRIEALWRLHRVHHSQEELSILSTFRTHPLVHLGFVVTAIPVLVLAANNATPALLLTMFACFGALPHANVRWTYGRMGRYLVSPSYHRVHHCPQGRLDINLGTIFTFWDRMSGRAIWPDGLATPPPTGLRGRPVPVEFSAERPAYLRILAAQLADPFVTGMDVT